MDYENSCADMLDERAFLDGDAGLCLSGDPIKCMLIWQETEEKTSLLCQTWIGPILYVMKHLSVTDQNKRITE